MSSFEKTLSILEDEQMVQFFVWRVFRCGRNGPFGAKIVEAVYARHGSVPICNAPATGAPRRRRFEIYSIN